MHNKTTANANVVLSKSKVAVAATKQGLMVVNTASQASFSPFSPEQSVSRKDKSRFVSNCSLGSYEAPASQAQHYHRTTPASPKAPGNTPKIIVPEEEEDHHLHLDGNYVGSHDNYHEQEGAQEVKIGSYETS